jgi:hypothetical protein
MTAMQPGPSQRGDTFSISSLRFVKFHSTFVAGKYPLRLESGRHCRVLQGFGETICQKLDKRLEEYRIRAPGMQFPKLRN